MYERSCYCHNNFLSFKYKQVTVFWIVMPSKKVDILLNIDCHNTISIHLLQYTLRYWTDLLQLIIILCRYIVAAL